MGHDDCEQPDVSRRDLGALLGLLGGGAALSALVSCASQDGSDALPESTGTTASALNGTTHIYWVDTVASLRALPGAANYVAILESYSAVSPPDGGGGVFVWSTAAATDDGGTILNAGGLNSSSAGWRRVFTGALDIRWFGASTGASDNEPAIANALAALGANGGTVYFPPGTYSIASTVVVGGSTSVRGITLRGATRGTSTATAALKWVGSSGGTMMQIQNADGGTLDGIGFDAAFTAAFGLQFVARSGDANVVENWSVEHCFFTNATSYNVLIGEAPNTSSTGCEQGIEFRNCFFLVAFNASTATKAHLMHRSPTAFSNAFYNCVFAGPAPGADGGITLSNLPNCVVVESGRCAFYSCLSGPSENSDYYLTTPASGVQPGGIGLYDCEAQTPNFLVVDPDNGSNASLYPVTVCGCNHSDILGTGTYSISWNRSAYASLQVIGGYMDRGVTVGSRVTAHNVNLLGVSFIGAHGSVSGGTQFISGTWNVDSTPAGGSQLMVGSQSIDFGTAAPTSGTWAQGSVRWNSAAAVGQPSGWRCTAGGSPGTWVAMANL